MWTCPRGHGSQKQQLAASQWNLRLVHWGHAVCNSVHGGKMHHPKQFSSKTFHPSSRELGWRPAELAMNFARHPHGVCWCFHLPITFPWKQDKKKGCKSKHNRKKQIIRNPSVTKSGRPGVANTPRAKVLLPLSIERDLIQDVHVGSVKLQ